MSRCTSPCAWRGRSPAAGLHADPEDLLQLEGAVTVDFLLQRGTMDVLHDQVGEPLDLAHGVDRDDVLVADRGGRPDLAGEPLAGRPRLWRVEEPVP